MLGNIASIATLILFIIYFAGRTIAIFSVKGIWHDQIMDLPKDRTSVNIVDEIGEDYGYSKLLISKEGIRNFKMYSLEYNSDYSKIIHKEEIFSTDFLNVDQAIAIHYETAETFPRFCIEYETPDYRKVCFNWNDNLKNGVMSEIICIKHTFKSFMYYFFR